MERWSRVFTGWIAASMMMVACSDVANTTPADERVGSDRDAQGCIPSAGYQWSELKADCIRIWETGIELTHQGSGDPTFSAYAIMQDDRAELFLPDVESSVILTKDDTFDEWRETDIDFVLTSDPVGAMIITDQDGFVMYRDDSVEHSPMPFVEHAADEVGGDIITQRGRVMRVEDGAYPMFTLHIQMQDRSDVTLFSLNAEDLTLNGANLADLEDRSILFEYAELEGWDLISIHPMGTDELADQEIGEGWWFVSGRLIGADEISGGDLPDTVRIQMISGDEAAFDMFIDEPMVALNDQDVSAWLAPRTTKTILSIEAEN